MLSRLALIAEEPDNLLVIFRFQNQVEGTPSIFWRPSKDMKDTLKDLKEVAIKQDSILLLKSHE